MGSLGTVKLAFSPGKNVGKNVLQTAEIEANSSLDGTDLGIGVEGRMPERFLAGPRGRHARGCLQLTCRTALSDDDDSLRRDRACAFEHHEVRAVRDWTPRGIPPLPM